MVVAFRQIRETQAANPKIPDMRTGAFVLAIEKIARSYEELGVFP
jgi:glutamate dehydrogenase (NAD(P)+)